MIRNLLLVAYRHLKRQWSYSLINLFGLAIGIGCSLVIFLFAYGEWSYDRGHLKGDRIYRIGVSFFNIGQFALAPEELLDVLPKGYAGIETATRIRKDRDVAVIVDDQTYVEPFAYFTDTAYFKMFDYHFLQGSAANVLSGPNDAIITKRLAMKYFGREEVIGKTLEVGKERTPYSVVAVLDDQRFNSHLNADLFLPIQSKITGEPVWSSAAFYSYVLLKPNQREEDLRSALNQMIEKHVFPESGQPMGFKTLEDYVKNENSVKFYVHALRDIYLQSKLNFEITPGGNESNIYVFAAISVFILGLAAVNFVNLTTARASRRAKEVGIRKALGTTRSKLIRQFLGESVLMSTASMIGAIFLAEFFLLIFQYVTGTPLMTTIWRNPSTVLLFFGFSLAVGLIAGLYPAFYLTAFQPIRVLKGNLASEGGGVFRNGLVVFQFSVSLILMMGAGLVQQQLHFMHTKDLGFTQDNIVTIDGVDKLGASASAFKTELERLTGVTLASFHVGEPGSKRVMTFSTYQTPQMQSAITINTYSGDADYPALLGMQMVKGRSFDRQLASDSSGLILNEAAVAALGLGDDPIGAKVNENQIVIGVVRDFHWESLRNAIAPVAIGMSKDPMQLGFKLDPGHASAFLVAAEKSWKALMPEESFRYHFVDENFGELLAKEKTFGKAMNVFTLLAIFVSCLGLYALSAYSAEQRTREIGIRKVMGASSAQIVAMLNKRYTGLVLLSLLIALPVTVYLGSEWLQGFAYRIELGAGLFVAASALTILIAWLTVSYHSVKASLRNPAETLKYE